MNNINIFIVNDPKFSASNYQSENKIKNGCPHVEECEANRPLSTTVPKTTIEEAREALFDAVVILKAAERALKDQRIVEAREKMRKMF